jgi:hypothetical protein
MKRRIGLAVTSVAAALAIVACARAPEPRTNASTDSSPAELVADASTGAAADGNGGGDARVPGLPMPQQFPRLVWDAAGVPRDAAR